MPNLSEDALVELLDAASDPVASECAAAIRDGGELIVWDSWSVPASHLFRTYRRRAKFARQVRLNINGIDRAIQRFQAAGSQPVGFAFVHGHCQQFSVWVRADGSAVIACFSVGVRY